MEKEIVPLFNFVVISTHAIINNNISILKYYPKLKTKELKFREVN